MSRRIDGGPAEWLVPGAVAVILVLAVIGYSWLTSEDGADPQDNDHAKVCVEQGHQVKERKQYGGKFYTYTYWCVDSDGQISDIWFTK